MQVNGHGPNQLGQVEIVPDDKNGFVLQMTSVLRVSYKAGTPEQPFSVINLLLSPSVERPYMHNLKRLQLVSFAFRSSSPDFAMGTKPTEDAERAPLIAAGPNADAIYEIRLCAPDDIQAFAGSLLLPDFGYIPDHTDVLPHSSFSKGLRRIGNELDWRARARQKVNRRGGSNMWTIIIIGVLLFGLWAWAAHAQNQSNIASAKRQLSTVPGYEPALVQSLGYNKPSISIDPTSSRLAITLPGQQPKLFHFNQIISAEVEKNGRSLTKTNRGSQAAGAAVGAVLLGPAGLLLGGLTGSKRTEELIKQVSLKIYTNDLISPVTTINFLDSWTGFKADSLIVKQAAQSADEWYGRLRAILQRQQMFSSVETAHVPPPVPVSTVAETADAEARQQEIMRRIEHKRLRRVSQANLEPEA